MATAGLIGPILGPILGGWLVVHTSWHWIFLINIPIGMLGFWAAAKVMGNHKGNTSKLDWTGFLLFAFGLVGLTLGLDLLGESHSDRITTYSALAIGIALLMAYYFYAKGNDCLLYTSTHVAVGGCRWSINRDFLYVWYRSFQR